MSVGPFDIAPVIERIKARCTDPAFRKVEGAAEQAEAWKAANPTSPAAYVLLATERALPKEGSSQAVIQAVQVIFAVNVCVQNYRVAELGMAALPTMQTMLAGLRLALIGWQPDAAYTAVELADSRLTRYEAGAMWWTQLFRTYYRLRVWQQH